MQLAAIKPGSRYERLYLAAHDEIVAAANRFLATALRGFARLRLEAQGVVLEGHPSVVGAAIDGEARHLRRALLAYAGMPRRGAPPAALDSDLVILGTWFVYNGRQTREASDRLRRMRVARELGITLGQVRSALSRYRLAVSLDHPTVFDAAKLHLFGDAAEIMERVLAANPPGARSRQRFAANRAA